MNTSWASGYNLTKYGDVWGITTLNMTMIKSLLHQTQNNKKWWNLPAVPTCSTKMQHIGDVNKTWCLQNQSHKKTCKDIKISKTIANTFHMRLDNIYPALRQIVGQIDYRSEPVLGTQYFQMAADIYVEKGTVQKG